MRARNFEFTFCWNDFFWAALLAVILGTSAAIAQAQACTPPIFQGSVNATGNCNRLSIRFLNTQSSTLIDHYVVRWTADGVVQTLPGSAIQAVRDDVTCQWSSQLQVTQYNKNGAVCSSTSAISPAPHTPACGLCSGGGASAGISIVSSANFRGQVSRGSLASLFPDPGTTFTDRQEFATTFNLPTTLGGVTVEAGGLICPLLAVAPGQVNILLPDSLPDGPTEVPIVVNSTRGTTARFTGRAQLNPQAPGIFTINANGEGRAASLWLILYASGGFNYFNTLPTLSGSERVFYMLYGTGIHATQAELRLGNGRSFASFHVTPSIFEGVQQLTFQVPVADAWRVDVGATVRVFTGNGGYYDSQGFTVR